MKVRAALATGLNEPWSTHTIDIDEPHAHEVKVKMAFAGMCHSDEHSRVGDMNPATEVLQFMGVDSMFPFVGGHEGSGIVESVGDGVEGFQPGDHVTVSFIPACGTCEYCASGRSFICNFGARTLAGPMMSDNTWRHHWEGQKLNRYAQLGTFSEYIVVHEYSLVKIPEWYDLRAAALISCGIATGFGSAANRAGVKPGDVVAVIGCGGVGSGALQGAQHAGARAVVAIDPDQSKVDRALKHGATHGATSVMEAAFNILPDLTMGQNCNVVILTPGRLTGDLIEEGRSILAKGGTMVATAIAPFQQTQVDLNLGMFTLYGQSLLGTVFGSVAPRVQIPRLLQLYHDGQLIIDDLITSEYSIEDVNQGYLDQASGKNIRGVVRF